MSEKYRPSPDRPETGSLDVPERPTERSLSVGLHESLEGAPNKDLKLDREATVNPFGKDVTTERRDAVLIDAQSDPEAVAELIRMAEQELSPDLFEQFKKNLQPSE